MESPTLVQRIDEHTQYLRTAWAVENAKAEDSTYDLLRAAAERIRQLEAALRRAQLSDPSEEE